MNQNIDFETYLAQALLIIDQSLARRDVRIAERPMMAAISFVRDFCTAIKSPEYETTYIPDDSNGFVVSDWFRKLYRQVVDWYNNLYGKTSTSAPSNSLIAAVSILGSPFLLRIPTAVSFPGEGMGTKWVQFPEAVLPVENAIEWIVKGPNFSALPNNTNEEARKITNLVASDMRCIYVKLLGVARNLKNSGILDGILPSIETAAQRIIESNAASRKLALWDMQMACEHSIKALSHQRSGTFKEIHDLYQLYDSVQGGSPSFERSLLSRIPCWKEMVDYRYGQGDEIDFARVFKVYQTCLAVVRGTVAGLSGYGLGQAKFLLATPPWLKS